MISVKREEVGKQFTARFNKSVSVEDLEKIGCLNFNALHKIAVERCKRHFDYDGSAYVCEYTCVGGKEKTQHSYIPTEDRFVCTTKRCSDRDFLHRLSIQVDLSFAYDFLKEEKKSIETTTSDEVFSDNEFDRDIEIEPAPNPLTGEDECLVNDKLKAEIESDLEGWADMNFPDPIYIHKFILERHINIIAGGEGVGKSTATLAIVAELSRKGIRTVYFSCEDDKDEIGRTLKIHKADFSNVQVICFKNDTYNLNDTGIKCILTAAQLFKAKLIVIDPLLSYAGDRKLNDEVSVRAALDPLRKELKNRSMAAVIIHHWNKEGKMTNSRQISAAARMVVQIFPSKHIPGAMVMVTTKNRHSDPNQQSSLAYKITADPNNPKKPRFEWLPDHPNVTWDDMQNGTAKDIDVDKEIMKQLNSRKSDDYEMLSKDLTAILRDAITDVSYSRIQRSKERLGITIESGYCYQKGGKGPYYVKLPEKLRKLK
jgi:hypothetical protein